MNQYEEIKVYPEGFLDNVVIIPGSFNPVTNAHLEMARDAGAAVRARHVIFVPAHDSYVARKGTLIPGKVRCRLINDASMKAHTFASDREVNSFLPKRTYETVSELKEQYNTEFKFWNFYICLGMDNIKTLTSWYNWEPLIKENRFIACRRENETLENALKEAGLEEYADRFLEIQIGKNRISSSLVRQLSEQGDFSRVQSMVPKNVCDYLRRFYDVFERL